MAVATTVGKADKPTPRGNFNIYSKIDINARVGMGLACKAIGLCLRPAASPGRYVGYPIGLHGANSRWLMDFTRVSFIPIRTLTAVCACTGKRRRSFTRWFGSARR